MQAMQPLAHLGRLQDLHRRQESWRLEIQEKGQRHLLQVVRAFRRFHRRTRQNPFTPRLLF
jgi:hypothetical protein